MLKVKDLQKCLKKMYYLVAKKISAHQSATILEIGR